MDDEDWLDHSGAQQGSSRDPLVDQEYQRLATRYSDAGYREGITDGKMATLQEGFDQSFSASVGPSRRIGKLRGRANALLSHMTSIKMPIKSTSTPGAMSGAEKEAITNNLRAYIKELCRVKRTDVLPPDLEMEAHEREAHGAANGDGEGYELDMNDSREMEALENALDGLGDAGGRQQNGQLREEELLKQLEGRLQDLVARVVRL